MSLNPPSRASTHPTRFFVNLAEALALRKESWIERRETVETVARME
jgi:hypothetical protein